MDKVETEQGTVPASKDDVRVADQTTATVQMDPDLAELAALRAQLEAEQRGSAGEQQMPAEAAPVETPAPEGSEPRQTDAEDKAGTEGGKPAAPIMIPKQRLDEEARARREAERELDFLRGQLEAIRAQRQGTETGTPATAPATAPANDPVQQMEALRAEVMAAADKFDAGEITMGEFKRIELDVQGRMREIEQRPVAAPVNSLADEAIITARTAQILDAHPIAATLTEQEATRFAAVVANEQAMLGRPFRPDGGAAETLRLREEVAKYVTANAERLGLSGRAPAPTTTTTQPPPAGSPGTSRPTPGLSAQAQDRLRKMDLAAGLPPDIGSIGAAAGDTGINPSAVLAMDEDAIMALPPAVRARMLSSA